MSSGGGGTSKTVSTQELSDEQQDLMRLVMPAAKDYAGTPLELFPGSTIAPTDPLQEQGRNMVADAAGGVQQVANDSISTARQLMMGGGAGALGGAGNLTQAGQFGLGGLGRALSEYDTTQGGRDFLASGSLLDPNTNPVLEAQTEAALRPITRGLTEDVLPGIRSESMSNNMFGGSRQGIAEGRAMSDFLTQAGDISTNLQANNFNQGLGAMLATTQGAREGLSSATGQGLGAGAAGTDAFSQLALRSLMESPNLASLAFSPGLALESVGSVRRGDEQARLSEEANRFTTEQMLPFLQAQDVAGLAFGLGGGSAVTEAQQSGGGGPMDAIAGLGPLAMMMMML